ncbi:hypothetical protein ABEB36_005195 [Hypothenemus hampei]|uniref:Uncharacterized protein n=1 Tax=Hypothenemus hampei TaxID=57062 RepID=A0ABD1EXD0_HYPHA
MIIKCSIKIVDNATTYVVRARHIYLNKVGSMSQDTYAVMGAALRSDKSGPAARLPPIPVPPIYLHICRANNKMPVHLATYGPGTSRA